MNNLKYSVKEMLDNYNQNGVVSETLLERVQIAYDAEEMQEKIEAIANDGRQNLRALLDEMYAQGFSFDETAECESILTTAQHNDEA